MCHSRFKKVWIGLVLVYVIFGFYSFALAEKITLRLGHEMPTDHPYHLGAEKMANIVKERTQGNVEIIIYPNATLGTQKEMAQAVSMGKLDFALTWNGILESYASVTGIFALPYIYRDWNHTWKFLHSDVAKEILSTTEAKGIKVIENMFNGTYSFVSRRPIRSFDELKGMKLRVQPSQVFVNMGKVLGSVVTPLAFSEIYTALQLGTIDAQIQGPVNVRKSKHYEVAKYCFETKMNHLLEPILMSVETFKKLSPEYQKVILEAAYEATVWQWDYALKEEESDRAWLIKEGGMEFYPANREEGVKVFKPLYDMYKDWAKYLDALQAIK